MSRPKRIPKYRSHSSGQAFVEIDGKRHYLGKYGTEESRERYNRIVAELCTGPKSRPLAGKSPVERADGITVVELIASYFEFARMYYMRNGKSTGTAERLRPVLRLLKAYYGYTLAAEFGPLALKALRQHMIDAGQSRKYINQNVGRIRRVFKWAASEELLPVTVPQALATVSGLRRGRSEAKELPPILPVDQATVDATLEHLPVIPRDMVMFQRLTGCRPGEVRLVRPCDVNRDVDPWEFRPVSHKTEHHQRERVIFIGPQAQAILRPYLLRQEKAYCFSPSDSEKKRSASRHEKRRTPMSCGNRPGSNRKRNPKRKPGRAYTKDTYNRAIARACEKAGMPPWSPNQLRHSCATEIRKRYGLEAAQVALGHSTANVTQIYAERDLALAAKIAREVG